MQPLNLKLLIGCILAALIPPAIVLCMHLPQSGPQPIDPRFNVGGEVLFFTSTRCGACRRVEPAVRQLMSEGFPMRKLDPGSDREMFQKYSIRCVPTFIYVVGDREINRLVGARSIDDLRRLRQ